MKERAYLRGRRKALGWTLAELEAKTGLRIAFLSYVERGDRSPSVTSAKKIAKALDIPWPSIYDDGVDEDTGNAQH
jgi:transcriptional regulator with XRE-family HTH domain